MKKRQQGLTTVEAAIGAALMLVILFGIIEISRLVFVWNYLDEVTRRGARVAAVCPFDHPAIRKAAIFSTPGGDSDSPHVGRLTTSDVDIEYLDATGGDPFTHATLTPIQATAFVRVSINGVSGNNLQIPLLLFKKVTLNAPTFTTILPSESLGFNPDTGTCRCFGTQGAGGTEGCDPPP